MDKLEQLLTKMHSEFAEYEAWLLRQPASVILENAFQYTTKQDILMHAESVDLSPAQLETLLHSRAPLEEVFETYRNTDSDFLMIEMHDAMETCADNAMAVQRTAPVYTQPPDYARERGELDENGYCFYSTTEFVPESERALGFAMAGNTGNCDDPDAPEGAYEYSRCCIITLEENGWHGEMCGTGW